MPSNTTFAVIKTGGKQYKVSPKDKIKIEKLDKPEGEEVVFDDVLLVSENGNVKIGNPLVEGAKVTAKILKQGKGEKLVVFKYKAKKRYKKKIGHRQRVTEEEIAAIKYPRLGGVILFSFLFLNQALRREFLRRRIPCPRRLAGRA